MVPTAGALGSALVPLSASWCTSYVEISIGTETETCIIYVKIMDIQAGRGKKGHYPTPNF